MQETTAPEAGDAAATSPDADGQTAAAQNPMDIIRRFGELYLKQKQLEAALDDVKAQRSAIEDAAMIAFTGMDVQRLPLNIGATVYVEEKLWAKAPRIEGTDQPDNERFLAGLRLMGLGHYIRETANTNSVSAWFRAELKRREEAMIEEARQRGETDALPIVEPEDIVPDEARGMVEVAVVHKLKAVKA